jgi:hypothetical protein
MTPPHELLQRHLGPEIQLGPHAQAQADHNPAAAARLAFLADVWGLNSKEPPGLGFGLGAGFFKAAWEGDKPNEQKSGSSPFDGFGNMLKTLVADALEFDNPYPPPRPPHRHL